MTTRGAFRIRPLASERDLEQCIALQRRIWGTDFRELVPAAILLIAERMGGVAAGAFDGRGRLCGFVFGITGVRGGQLAHWSHMLAVAPAWRDRGVGRRLKRYQRARLRRLGVERVFWTYDPLIARNAHLNLNRLGARVLEYRRDVYGRVARSSTDTVIGSDRFVVAWDLDAARPRRPVVPRGAAVVDPDTTRLPAGSPVLIAVPADIQTLKRRRPARAKAWRAMTRRALEHYLARGYRVTGFLPATSHGGGAYVLERNHA